MSLIITELKEHVLSIGLNRPRKMNAFTVEMLTQLSEAFTRLEEDEQARCGLIYAEGDNFTGGLDLGEVGPHFAAGDLPFFAEKVDPLQLFSQPRTKPLVIAVQGYCLTIGVELILASDICIADPGTKFGLIEIKRGIFPFGGATIRFPQRCGWGNAMRYLLTGDLFGAQEAQRIGMIQELSDNPLETGWEIAKTIAEQAPLGVQAILKNAQKALQEGFAPACADLMPTVRQLMQSEDAAEGLNSFLERRKAVFKGK